MAGVELVIRDRVAHVVLDRPPLNVVDLGMAGALAAVFDGLARERALAAVVLEARGRAFSAGVDVRDHLPDRGAAMIRAFDRACLALFALEPPVVATVTGAALGGGCELLLACDLVNAGEAATFGFPEIALGVFPPVAAVALGARIGAARAADLVLTGRTIAAAEAERIGLVSRVVPEAGVAAARDEVLARFRSLSPAALRAAKRALALGRPPALAEAVAAAERLYFEERLEAADAIEGLNAFLAKRAPAWPAP